MSGQDILDSHMGAIGTWIQNYVGLYTDEDNDGSAAPAEKKPAAKASKTSISLENAKAVLNSQGLAYGDIPTDKLANMANQLTKSATTDEHRMKLDACRVILADRAATGA